MRILITVIFLFSAIYSTIAQSNDIKEISGIITYLNRPLEDVNIIIKSTSKGTKTNAQGQYQISAQIGDEIVYSYAGFNSISVKIEDVTNILNIEMDNYVTELDEVVIDVDQKRNESLPLEFFNRKVTTSLGNINPMLVDGARYFPNNRINTELRTLSDALKFYYPKGLPTSNFELDGKLHKGEPYVDMSTVRDIYYVPNYPTNKLDPFDRSVIIIRTTNSEEYRAVTTEKHRNQNYYANDAVAIGQSVNRLKPNERIIEGKVSSSGKAVANVNISIVNTYKGTKTDANGNYSLKAKIGDQLQYSHIGYKPITILVEDVTSVLNIELQENVNVLEEAVVEARRSPQGLEEYEAKMDAEFMTSFGIFKPNAAGTKVHYVSGEDLGSQYTSLSRALQGKFSGTLPSSYDVDGLLYPDDTFIDLATIKDVYVTKGIVIVRTMYTAEEIAQEREKKAEKYRNQNYYAEDAKTLNKVSNISLNHISKSIAGKIMYLGASVPDVNIKIANTSRGTKTDNEGFYTIEAQIGDKLIFSHVSYKTITIVVEDVTSILNIEMVEKTNQLKEAVVTARTTQESIDNYIERLDIDLQIPGVIGGTINPLRSGFVISHLPGEKINAVHRTLESALDGKFSGVQASGIYPNQVLKIRGAPAIYAMDGMIYDQPPPIPLSRIKDIYIYKSKGLVILVTVDSYQSKKLNRVKISEQNRNQNYYQDDALSIDSNANNAGTGNDQIKSGKFRRITGQLTYLDAPLADANIIVEGSSRGTSTNQKGKFTIRARVGEILQFSYVGFKTVKIVVEDVTKQLNIEMLTLANALDEVVVTAKTTKGEVLQRSIKAEKRFNTSRGTFNPKTAGYAVGFVDGDELSNTYSSLREALRGKISGFQVKDGKGYIRGTGSSITQDYPVAWEVDGVFTTDEPTYLDLSQIKSIHALKTLAATNKYGTLGAGGVIVVTTKFGDFENGQQKGIDDSYTNKNYYNEDAIATAENLYVDDISLKELDQKVTTETNPEILKSIAYQYQALGLRDKAIEVYEKVFKLRPSYAQSYRDLANAYHENDQFKKSWRLYMSYLMQGHDVSGEGIGQIIYNEMEYLYFNRRNQTPIKEAFIPKNESIDEFRNDVRIVFEWNTSEAEFDLEFVSPDRRAYTFEHSLDANQELITDEKTKGYSSKEFMIDDVGDGEWLVNITYKGNKRPEPTYFKVTTYFHWGKSAQYQEVKVYQFQEERHKIQLLKMNRDILLATRY